MVEAGDYRIRSYRGTQTPADQLALDEALRPSIQTNTFNNLPRGRTPLRNPGGRQIFLFETLDGHGLAKEITLHFVAAQRTELTQLLLCLDTFRYGIEL